MSLEDFISGKSAVSSCGAQVPRVENLLFNDNNMEEDPNDQLPSSFTAAANHDEEAHNEEEGGALANRTTNLISSYRDFISNQDDEEMMMRTRIVGSGTSSSDGSRERPLLSTSPPRSRRLDILSHDTLDDELWSNDDNSDDSNGMLRRHHGRTRYTHPIYHSKKFKRVLLGVVCVTAILGTIGIVQHSKREKRLPNWDAELKEALKEEKYEELLKEEDRNGHVSMMNEKAAEVVAQYDNNDNDNNQQSSEHEEAENAINTHHEESAAAMIDHVIQNSSSEQQEQSAAVPPSPMNNKQQPVHHIVPAEGIEAITRYIMCCKSSSPTSTTLHPNRSVVNAEEEDEQQQTNLSTNDVAAEYAQAESYHPTWYDRSHGWTGTTYTEAVIFCSSQSSGGDTVCPYEVYCPTGPHHIPLGGYRGMDSDGSAESSSRSPISNYDEGWVQVGSKNSCVQYSLVEPLITMMAGDGAEVGDEVEDEENDKIDELLSLAEDYKEQEQATLSESSELPSYEIISSTENQGVGLVDEKYVPVVVESSSSNTYVVEYVNGVKVEPTSTEVSNTHTVTVAEYVNGVKVEPTSTEVSKQQQEEDEDTVSLSTTGTATTTDNFDMTAILHEQFHPLWLSANEGWHGGSHDDAVEFCNSIRGKKLCPYSAMCPQGQGHAVMGGHHQTSWIAEGLQYAPILGGKNHWVMIGTKDGKEETTCMTHRQLEGSAPLWGLTSDRIELKQHVMCCTIN